LRKNFSKSRRGHLTALFTGSLNSLHSGYAAQRAGKIWLQKAQIFYICYSFPVYTDIPMPFQKSRPLICITV